MLLLTMKVLNRALSISSISENTNKISFGLDADMRKNPNGRFNGLVKTTMSEDALKSLAATQGFRVASFVPGAQGAIATFHDAGVAAILPLSKEASVSSIEGSVRVSMEQSPKPNTEAAEYVFNLLQSDAGLHRDLLMSAGRTPGIDRVLSVEGDEGVELEDDALFTATIGRSFLSRSGREIRDVKYVYVNAEGDYVGDALPPE